MLILKINDKELKVKFGYKATVRTKLLTKLAKNDAKKNDGMEGVEELLLLLPEVLLIGLQKFHYEEYGFDYETECGKEEQIEEMFQLIDDYIDTNETEDAITLYNALLNELMKNGFLKSMYQKELSNAKENAKKE